MSWAAEDWTAGLSGRALQKVRELQAHIEKLNRERQQKQLQLDNSDAALHKQKQKCEEMRVELAAVQRELVGVREEVRGEARARERLAQELQAKVAQVCALEGQLDSARALTQSLTQEVKRLEAELEKLQKGSGSGDSMLFSTPCWNMNSPWDQSVGKNGAGGEGNPKAHPVRQQLLFGETPKPSVSGVSSEFAQQPHRTPPLRRRIYQSEAHSLSVFPWERDDTRSTPRGRPVSTPSSSISSNDVVISDNNSRDKGSEEALRKERDDACVRVSALQKELHLEQERRREAEACLAQAHKELSVKEQNVSRSTEELTRARTRVMQEGDRAQVAEQRVKQLQEELKCQRQNSETSRCNAEQRRRDMEREHQRELQELQRERQSLEKQHHQESSRLGQEIQQARTLHNTLQAQYDKLTLQKQAVERDLEGVQAKLKNTEADLTESQKREAQTLLKLTESLRECEALSVSLEQLKKKEKSLEADVKKLTEELAEALKLIKELQAQLAASPEVSRPSHPASGHGFTPVPCIHHDRTSPLQRLSQRTRSRKDAGQREACELGVLEYPLDREPGEGMDSEHISVYGSENAMRPSSKQAGGQHEAGGSGGVDMDSSTTEQDTGIEDTDTESYMSDSTSECVFKDDAFPQEEIENSASLDQVKKKEPSVMELKKENTSLRDELWDAKRELEQRLEDLETQRRAEAEARTKLKQLSKKHSTQAEQHRTKALELKEMSRKLEAQLDAERKESARLREALEIADKRRREEEEKDEEERQEENTQLKQALADMTTKVEEQEGERGRMLKQLEALQSELVQEQERRKEMEQEKKQLQNTEMEGLKIAELDQLQRSAGLEDKKVKDNMPLTYLQLGNQSNTTNDITALENDVILPISFCESENLQNVAFPKETETTALTTGGITQSKPKCSQQDTENNATAEDLKGQSKTEMMVLDNTTVLVLEVESLRTQRDREAERAKSAQKKLDSLQRQVTSQTQQLTIAFESQSKHIEDLLMELQQRDNALQRQEVQLQNCLEEIALLKSEKQKEIVSGLETSDPEQAIEVFEDPHCELETTTEIAKEASQLAKAKPLYFDPLQPSSNEEHKNDQPDIASPTSDESHMSTVTTGTEGHVSLPMVHVLDTLTNLLADSTMAQGPLEHLDTAQEGSHRENPECQEVPRSTETHTHTQHDASDTLQRPLEYSADDLNVLTRLMHEFREAQNELSSWKAKHKELSVQLEEVSREDVLAIKQENEQLKSKFLDKENSLAEIRMPKRQESLNTQEEDVSSNDCTEHRAGASSGLEGRVEVDGSSVGEFRNSRENVKENGESEKDALCSPEVESLQEQLQVLQTQHQMLSEQSKQQAEELQLWRLSALSPEETWGQLSNGHSIVLVREDELLLPCSPDALHVYSGQSRSMVQQGGNAQQRGCFSCGTGDHQLQSEKSEVHRQPTLRAKELIANGNSSMQACDHLKLELRCTSISTTFSSSAASSSDTESSDHKSAPAHQGKATGPGEAAPQTASVSHDDQPEESPSRAESQDHASVTAETQTKVISPKLNTSNNKPSQKPGIKHDDTCTSLQHGEALVSTADCQSKHAAPPSRQTDNLLLKEQNAVMCPAVDLGQRSDVAESPSPGKPKVKSTFTQTDVCTDVGEEALGSSACGPSVAHASTQTQPQQTEEEETQDGGATDFPPLPPTPALDTETLLFSGSFPIPADPAHLAERIRRSRSRMSVAYDDTEYEPYGLPEVVMKGFADIPVGPACPYVLRRGLLGTDALPPSLREPPLKEIEEEIDP